MFSPWEYVISATHLCEWPSCKRIFVKFRLFCACWCTERNNSIMKISLNANKIEGRIKCHHLRYFFLCFYFFVKWKIQHKVRRWWEQISLLGALYFYNFIFCGEPFKMRNYQTFFSWRWNNKLSQYTKTVFSIEKFAFPFCFIIMCLEATGEDE